MDQVLLFIVLGLGAGAVYAVLAASLVAVYSATGVINFAQGSIALWAVWVTAQLRDDGRLVAPIGSISLTDGSAMGAVPAVAVGVVCAVIWAAAAHFLVFRPLRTAPMLAQVVASVGLMLFIQSLVTLRFETQGKTANPILPTSTIAVGDSVLNVTDLVLGALAVAVGALLWAYFRFTGSGTATRAAAEDERGARLLGYNPDRLAGFVWVLTGAASAFVCVLASPSIGLDPLSYTFYVIPALAAALLGKLTNIPLATLAGLVIGSFQSLLLLMATKPYWPIWAQAGFGDAIPFVIVIVALFALGRRIPERGTVSGVRMPEVHLPELSAAKVLIAAVAMVAAVLLTNGVWRFALVTSTIMMLIALSLVLLTGYLGQISLASMAFAGAAGFALSKLTINLGVPFPLSVLAAATIAAATGALLGLPAVRIRGAQLAVVTLAGALALQNFVFGNPAITPFEGNLIGRPVLLGLDLSVRDGTNLATARFSLMVVAVVGVMTVLVMRVLAGRTGRAFLAVRSNERAAASAGINVAATKLLGFVLSGLVAGVGGCLLAYSRGQVSVGSYTVTVGLALLCMVYIGGISQVSGAVVAGLIAPLGLVYTLLSTTFEVGHYYHLIAAGGLLLTAVLNPAGLAGTNRHIAETLHARRRTHSAGSEDVVTPREKVAS